MRRDDSIHFVRTYDEVEIRGKGERFVFTFLPDETPGVDAEDRDTVLENYRGRPFNRVTEVPGRDGAASHARCFAPGVILVAPRSPTVSSSMKVYGRPLTRSKIGFSREAKTTFTTVMARDYGACGGLEYMNRSSPPVTVEAPNDAVTSDDRSRKVVHFEGAGIGSTAVGGVGRGTDHPSTGARRRTAGG